MSTLHLRYDLSRKTIKLVGFYQSLLPVNRKVSVCKYLSTRIMTDDAGFFASPVKNMEVVIFMSKNHSTTLPPPTEGKCKLPRPSF